MFRAAFFAIALLTGSAVPALAAGTPAKWEPWVAKRPPGVYPRNEAKGVKPGVPGSQTWSLIWMVKFYQMFISPADGGGCTYYPTCSGYSIHALRKHGPVLGFIMTAERVNRNHSNQDSYFPQLNKFGKLWIYDPVENNDFWLDESRRTGTNIFAHPYDKTEVFWNHY